MSLLVSRLKTRQYSLLPVKEASWVQETVDTWTTAHGRIEKYVCMSDP